MLIVRGKDTSLEKETNVFNPFTYAPYGEGNIANRWRRGEVFDIYEAETWANLVVCSGGNVMVSDRLSMLNKAGMDLLYTHLVPQDVAAVPLDFSDGEVAGLWYTDEGEEQKLLMINLGDVEMNFSFCFADYDLTAPKMIEDNKNGIYENGVFTARLHRHESVVLRWRLEEET